MDGISEVAHNHRVSVIRNSMEQLKGVIVQLENQLQLVKDQMQLLEAEVNSLYRG